MPETPLLAQTSNQHCKDHGSLEGSSSQLWKDSGRTCWRTGNIIQGTAWQGQISRSRDVPSPALTFSVLFQNHSHARAGMAQKFCTQSVVVSPVGQENNKHTTSCQSRPVTSSNKPAHENVAHCCCLHRHLFLNQQRE